MIDGGNMLAQNLGVIFFFSNDLRAIYEGWEVMLSEYNGDTSWTLPIPTRTVIDIDGTVRYLDINLDYTQRPDPADALAVQRDLTGK